MATGTSLALGVTAGCLGDGGTGNGNDDGDGDDDGFAIEPGTRVLLEGITGGYEGLEPAAIAGVQNPTLILEVATDYEIGWTQGDGGNHNIQIWNADETVVDDHETDLTGDPGDGDYLTFTATDEMTYYRCNPHPNMQGTIRVV